jgi:hypothetical protein
MTGSGQSRRSDHVFYQGKPDSTWSVLTLGASRFLGIARGWVMWPKRCLMVLLSMASV